MKYNWLSGMIMLIPEGSLPDGWSRYDLGDGKLIRGGSTHGVTGGTGSHTHSFDPSAVWSGQASIGGILENNTDPNSISVVKYQHRHTINLPAATSGGSSTSPAYINVIIAIKN